jgi:hypothetical protein
LRASNTYTGATTITGGTTNLDYSATGTNTSKLSTSAALNLNRATLNILGATASGIEQIVLNTVIGAGATSITRTASTTGTLRANDITRAVGGVLNLGEASIVSTDRLNTNAILGGWATVAGTNWAINSTGAADGLITALGTYTTTTDPTTWGATGNISLTASSTTTGARTINSFKIDTAATTTALSVPQTAATQLTVDSGGILILGSAAATRTIGTATATITAGTTTNSTAYRAGATDSELFFHVGTTAGTNIVASNIINNSALTPTTVGLAKTQAGTLILTGTNTYTGQTTIAGGTLQIGNGAAAGTLGTGGAVVNNGTLVFNRSDSIAVSNNISGIGAVTQNNLTSTLTLSGNNTYMGITNLTLGGITAGSATALSPNSTFNFANVASAVLNLGGFATELGNLSGGGTTGGNITMGSANLTVGRNNSAQTYSGAITGTGTFTKVGNGVLTLANTNTGFTGKVVVGTTDRNTAGSGLTITGTAANTTITEATVNAGTLNYNNAFNNTLNGPATIHLGTLTFAGVGNNTVVGPVVSNGGTLSFTAGGVNTITNAVTLNNGGALTFSGNGNNVVNGVVTVNNGAVTISGTGNNNINNNVTVNTGTLTLSSSGNTTITGNLALSKNGFANYSNTTTGIATVGGTTTLGDAATLTVANVGNFTGMVTANDYSTVNFSSATATSRLTGGLTVGANAAALTLAGNYIYGAPGVTLSNSGAVAAAGFHRFDGPLTINGGGLGLTLGNNETSSQFNGAVTVTAGALTLGANRSISMANCTTTSGNNVITTVNTAGLIVGMAVTGTNIPANAAISAISPGVSYTITGTAPTVGAGSLTHTATSTLTNMATTFGSTTVTCAHTGLLVPGMVVVNANLSPGTTVTSVAGSPFTTFTVSAPALATSTAQTANLTGASALANSATTGTTTVTTASTAGLAVGMSITGTNIPSGATVASITNSTTFELSVAASGTASGLRLGAVAPTRVAGLLTVGNNGTFTSTADNKLEGGLLVQAGGFVTALSGHLWPDPRG